MRDVRQAASVPTFYARGLRGPLKQPFHGFVVCKVRVTGTKWDDVFLGPDSQGLPDLRVSGPTRTVLLPPDTSTGYAGFPDVQLDPGGTLRLVVTEMDDAFDDPVGALTLSTEHGFPMEAKEGPLSASCVAVPPEVYEKELEELHQKAERALDLAQPPFGAIDVTRSDASRAKIDAAREAIRRWARFAGPDSEVIRAAIDREEVLHEAWKRELFAALEARLAEAPPQAEWRELPSAKVRAEGTVAGAIEILAKRTLSYDWRTKALGSIELYMLDEDGERAQPVFVKLVSFGPPVNDLSATIQAGQTLELDLSRGANARPLAIVVVEGPRAVVLPFRPKK
jgi:hypothetical protein